MFRENENVWKPLNQISDRNMQTLKHLSMKGNKEHICTIIHICVYTYVYTHITETMRLHISWNSAKQRF